MVRQLAWLLILAPSLAARAAGPLDAPCRLDWRGVPLQQALGELAGRLGLPYLLDASVTDQTAQTPVRLFAVHLTGRQALRWLARWAGLEAVVVDGTVLIARPDRLPGVWRGLTPTRSPDAGPAGEPPWQAARQRQADVNWTDAPLSLVARDLAARFGIDLIFHAQILKRQELIYLHRSQLRLDHLCEVLARHFDADIDYVDGALWARPKPDRPTSRPGQGAVGRPARVAQPKLDPRLARPVVIARPAARWPALGDLLAKATGLSCRVVVPPGTAAPAWEARGSAAEILEAGKLLGRLDYQLQPPGSQKPPVLLIQVRPVGRYSP